MMIGIFFTPTDYLKFKEMIVDETWTNDENALEINFAAMNFKSPTMSLPSSIGNGISDALEVGNRNTNALCMLGDLEHKNDDWVKAKDTYRATKDASNGKDFYATLCLGNWNYFAAIRYEKRAPKLEATHLEKLKKLYPKVMVEHPANMYAAKYQIVEGLYRDTVMSSDSVSSEVTYTSISSHGDPLAWVAPLLPDYVPGPEYPEYLAPSDEEVPVEDQPYVIADSPIALSSGFVADSDPEEDSKDGPVDYPADGGDGNDDDSSDNDEEEEASNEEDEEHLAPTDSVVAPVPMPFPSEEEVKRLLALPPPTLQPPHLTITHLSQEETPASVFETATVLRASSPSTYHLLHSSPPLPPSPSSLHLPPHNRKEDIPEAAVPPRKRLCLTALTSRYEVRESSTAAPRPTGGHGIDYGFIGTLDAKTRRQRAEEVGYGNRDVWEQDTWDIYDVIEDTQDRQTLLFQRVDGLVKDRHFHYETAQLLDQEALVSREAWAHSVGLSSAVHYKLQAYKNHTTDARTFCIASQLSVALGQIQALQARGQTHADVDDREGAASTAVELVFSFLVSDNHNNMPPRRSSATARAAAARAVAVTAVAATPMTVAVVEQLIEARVSAALVKHETLRNSTNGQGDGSHNSDTGIRGTIRTPHECTYKDFLNCKPLSFKENQVKFATCTFLGNALTWWNSHMKTVTQDVAYAMDWKALKKMMIVKFCPRGEIKKLEIELWNLKVKGTDVASYTLRFQELALMCGRMFHDESDEIEKYVGGLPYMIRGMGTNNKTRGRTLEVLTLLGLVKRGSTWDHFPCIQNATITTKGHVLPGVISARRLAIWLMTVGVLVPMVIITIVGTSEQLRMLALARVWCSGAFQERLLEVEE
ncbi:reverse transcriptase domain-containing protein [Tanacetum coccineum]